MVAPVHGLRGCMDTDVKMLPLPFIIPLFLLSDELGFFFHSHPCERFLCQVPENTIHSEEGSVIYFPKTSPLWCPT